MSLVSLVNQLPRLGPPQLSKSASGAGVRARRYLGGGGTSWLELTSIDSAVTWDPSRRAGIMSPTDSTVRPGDYEGVGNGHSSHIQAVVVAIWAPLIAVNRSS
jgi:hypothetical protein